MRKSRVVSLIFVLLFVGFVPTKAKQISSDPLIFNLRGDLWAWNGEGTQLQQLTEWGYNFAPVLSPDGQWAAYRSYAQITVDWFQAQTGGGSCDCDFPANIWLLNTRTAETSRLVDQPEGAAFRGPDDDMSNFLLRSDPVWSPDGNSLAWTEFVPYLHSKLPDTGVKGHVQLVTYDMTSKNSRVIARNIKDVWNGGQFPVPVRWSEVGLAVGNFLGDMINPDLRLLVYSPSGKLLASNVIDVPSYAFWMKTHEKQYLCCKANKLIDPLTAENADLPGIPELYSLTTPDGINVRANQDNWTILASGGASMSLNKKYPLGEDDVPFVISRDGKRLAYIKQPEISENPKVYQLLVYDGNQTTQVLEVDSRTVLVWGPAGWRFGSRPIPK